MYHLIMDSNKSENDTIELQSSKFILKSVYKWSVVQQKYKYHCK